MWLLATGAPALCRQFFFPLTAVLCLLVSHSVRAHHDSGSGLLISGQVQDLSDYILFQADRSVGGPQDRQITLGRVYLEKTVLRNLALFATGGMLERTWPGRPEQTRLERPRLGVRYRWQAAAFRPMVFFLRASAGGRSGANRQRFVDENFYDGSAEFTASVPLARFFFSSTVRGTFPASRIKRGYLNEEWTRTTLNIIHPHEIFPDYPEKIYRETHQQKKVTEWEMALAFRWNDSLAMGFTGLYRRPYFGSLKNRATGNFVPSIHREIGFFAAWGGEAFNLEITYRYPLYRGRFLDTTEKLMYFLIGQIPPEPKQFRTYAHAWQIGLQLPY